MFDAICRVLWILVLPDPDDVPASGSQRQVVAAVSGYVSIDLGGPVVAVGFRHAAVLGASVPVAAVDEDGHLLPREDEVGMAPKPWKRHHMHAISESPPVQNRSDLELGARVLGSIALHHRPDGG